MFHVEQFTENIYNKLKECPYVTNEKSEKLYYYASMIHETNKKFNLTGHKDLGAVIDDLIINTVLPVKDLNVPRGTSFIDIGTGSGIPGVVLSVVFDHMTGQLIDSNEKKIDFINNIKENLALTNMNAAASRAEEYVADNRNLYDICFTRAFGPLYYSAEFGFPALKQGGYLYVYSHLTEKDLSLRLKIHFTSLGGVFSEKKEYEKLGLLAGGLLCEKRNVTPLKYPRRFAVVKREAAKIPETES